MANKDNVTKIPLDGLLNLNKYRNEIKQFDGFNKKNSPIYGGLLSPMYKIDETVSTNSRMTFVNNDEYSLIKDESNNVCRLYKNDKNGSHSNPIFSLPIKNITKETIKVPYNVLAFEQDEENSNYIDMFVEGSQYYNFIRYDISTKTFTNLAYTNIYISKISKVEMKYGFAIFYHFDKQLLMIVDKLGHIYDFSWSWIVDNNIIDKLKFSINKLKSSFDYNRHPRYIMSVCGIQHNTSASNYTGYGNYIIQYSGNGKLNGYEVKHITLKSTLDRNLSQGQTPLEYYQIPTFALYSKVNQEDVVFYNIFGNSMENKNTTYYLRGIANSYDDKNSVLYIDCKNAITLDNVIPSKTNNKIASIEVNSYFYSILIKTNKTSNGVESCINHHVLFDSTRDYFIGNCGYIPKDYGEVYVPYGFKIFANNWQDGVYFSFLINYGNITNIAINDTSYISHIGTTLAEWNFIDNEVTPKVYYSSCIYKISNENTITLIQVKDEMPEMEVLFDRYIVFKTTTPSNILDTLTMSLYHGFVDYNNRAIPCENSAISSIEHFPRKSDDTSPYILNATLTDYLYTSAINPNMEISKINLSSIQYNPSVINQGCYKTFDLNDSSYTIYSLNESVSVYLSDNKQTLIPKYYCTFTKGTMYKDESLRDIPFPVARNGNILYSANLFSKIINSYSNKDMIINDTVAYPLTYINNQPSFSFFFLNGIEGVNSAFILHGMNYVNTDDFIFAVNYNGDTIGNTEAIVSIKGFRFLGNTTKVAYFYSELKKSVYAFHGDRTLEKVYDCTEIKNIRHTFFNPINYNIYITTDDYIYVIDDNTSYRIEISGTKRMYFSDKYIFVGCENEVYILMYEKYTDLLLYDNNTIKKVPIKLETQLYGMGNNIKSVIDCIYLRLFNNDIVEQGKLKLGVKTLTDKGETTEEKVFEIKASDWDKETNTFYIRYQPKNQECIGMSVNLESDFAIADFDIGYSTDGTIQVSKYNV